MTADVTDMGSMGKFETEEKEGHKTNERLHGAVVGVEKNEEGKGKGRRKEGIETDEDQPLWSAFVRRKRLDTCR